MKLLECASETKNVTLLLVGANYLASYDLNLLQSVLNKMAS